MKSLAILLAITAVAFAAEQCLVYSCNNALPKGTCSTKVVNPSNITYQMKACEDSKICDVRLKGEDKCADFYDQKLAYPGEFCRNDKECIRGKCDVNNTKQCILSPGNETCTDDLDCNPGLFCKAGNCVALKMDKEACGKEDKCHPSFACNDSVCVKIGTGKIGEKASSPIICNSFYLEDGVCKEGPKLSNYSEDRPVQCPQEGVCTYKFKEGDRSFTDKCRCGRASTGAKYCQPGRGDISMQDVRLVLITCLVLGLRRS